MTSAVPPVHDLRAAAPGSGASPRGASRSRACPRRGRVILLASALALLAALPGPLVARAEEPAASPSPAASPAPGTAAPPLPSPAPEPPATPAPDPSVGPTPFPTAVPPATPSPDPTPAPAPVVITRSLYRSGAVVPQYTNTWCVPASVQTMTNLILGTRDTSYATQKLLASVTYRFNRYRYDGPGNDIRGWAGALNWRLPDTLPVVYRDRSFTSRQQALDAIVDAIDETGYPVGITVRHGGHAWSVLGYQVRQVPGEPSTRQILGFYVVGPLGSPSDPWPVRLQAIDGFLAQYTRYYEDQEREPWHLDYVLVRPELTTRAGGWPRP